MGSEHASCFHHHSSQSSSEARLSASWRASRPPMHAWHRHSSRSPDRQHLLEVTRPPPPAPSTHAPAPATTAVAPSGRRQAATTCSGYAHACTSHHGDDTFWTSPDRRHGSPLPPAAAAPLFPVLPWLSSSSCRRWSLRGWRGKWWREALPMMVLGLGLNWEPRPKPMKRSPGLWRL